MNPEPSTLWPLLLFPLTFDGGAASVPRVDAWTLGVAAAIYVVVALTITWGLVPFLKRQIDSGPFDGLLMVIVRGWLRLVHRIEWVDRAVIPDELASLAGRGAIVVANHASGVDPFAIQIAFHRRIRWLMAKDQMIPALRDLWEHLGILPVSYGRDDSATFKEALRHVQRGGILGIFPEGAIARPPRQVRPFLPGVGLLVARSKAPVVLCLIEGAPEASSALASLFVPARVRVRCLGVFEFGKERDVEAITARLRQAIVDASGWPPNDQPIAGVGKSES
jgi:1-acyl-sn-glycerol-3-phosphate acyltransferase